MEYIFGPNARVFSFGNILLHAINIFLLWLVLKKYDAPKNIRLLAPFIFAYYYLNCSAVEWISVGHDLWVTGLLLLYILKLKSFHEKPGAKNFIAMFLLGWAAALFKESGLIAIGIYFAYFQINKANPFKKEFFIYSSMNIVSYTVFMIFYFLTRTVVDKQIVLGVPVLINIWYFSVYLLLPFAKRLVDGLSMNVLAILQYIKVICTLILPPLLVYAYIKGSRIIKLFILWPIFFITTIAVFKWGVALFTLYPNDPASRFMYSPFVGMAVCIAWGAIHLAKDIMKFRLNMAILMILGMIFITANFTAIRKSSSIFIKQQRLSQSIIDDIGHHRSILEKVDSIIILIENIQETEQIVASGEHLHAILLVQFDKSIKVAVIDSSQDIFRMIKIDEKYIVLRWDKISNHLIAPTS
jgi:hypothetical protein